MDRLRVISIISQGKYKLQLKFSDGTEGVLDLSAHAGKGVFKSWDENDYFDKVYINELSGAISWPSDIDIDTLQAYFTIKGITPEQYFEIQKKYAEYQ
jgi:hypothetical protein